MSDTRFEKLKQKLGDWKQRIRLKSAPLVEPILRAVADDPDVRKVFLQDGYVRCYDRFNHTTTRKQRPGEFESAKKAARRNSGANADWRPLNSSSDFGNTYFGPLGGTDGPDPRQIQEVTYLSEPGKGRK